MPSILSLPDEQKAGPQYLPRPASSEVFTVVLPFPVSTNPPPW